MKAWLIESDPSGNRLLCQDVPDPVPGPDDLLIEVHAIGLNRADLSRRAGHFEQIPTRPSLPIAGLEAAGTVIAAGQSVRDFKVGDRVMGLPAGAYAEKTLLHARLAMRVPQSISWVQAAATPVAMLTAHNALLGAAAARSGERVLVQAASSAVGIAAVQVARAFGASMVIGTAGSAEKLSALVPFGLTDGINYKTEAIADRVLALTGGEGVDVIVDMVGATAAGIHLRAAALRARWVQVGRMSGKDAMVDLDLISKKRLKLLGVTFRTLDLNEFETVVRHAERDLALALLEGRFSMPVARTFGFEQADRAQDFMREHDYFGKIVLQT